MAKGKDRPAKEVKKPKGAVVKPEMRFVPKDGPKRTGALRVNV